jgi:hypothetical protein
VVPRGTTRDSRGRDNDGNAFEQARNVFFAGEGIGRRFIVQVLPSGRLGTRASSLPASWRHVAGWGLDGPARDSQDVGRSVLRGTEVRGKHDGGFEQARNAFFAGGGIGRRFIVRVLPSLPLVLRL